MANTVGFKFNFEFTGDMEVFDNYFVDFINDLDNRIVDNKNISFANASVDLYGPMATNLIYVKFNVDDDDVFDLSSAVSELEKEYTDLVLVDTKVITE